MHLLARQVSKSISHQRLKEQPSTMDVDHTTMMDTRESLSSLRRNDAIDANKERNQSKGTYGVPTVIVPK